MTPEQRLKRIQALKACRNCLSLTHPLERCRSNSMCFRCGARHHTMIHTYSNPRPRHTALAPAEPSTSNSAPSKPPNSSPALTNTEHTRHNDQIVLLGTALIHAKTKSGEYSTIRALLDPASTRSCITSRCANTLGLTIYPIHQPFTGLGGVPVVPGHGRAVCDIKPLDRNGPCLTTEAVVIPEIVGSTPPVSLPSNIINNFAKYSLADPSFGDTGPIDFLLGADLFVYILSSRPNKNLKRSVLNTIFGDVIMGPISSTSHSNDLVSFCTTTADALSSSLTRFWEIEEVPTATISNPVDDLCEQHFVSTHRRSPDGRYIVSLPFKKSDIIFPESRAVAVKRFLSLEHRFLRNPKLKENCFSFLHEYEKLGHMEPSIEEAAYVLPYFCVFNPHSKSTPVRVVFDGSAKCSHHSLNDFLHPGPKLQKQVSDVILNFRIHRYVFCCDIVKMFRQILLCTEDRKYTHILLRENPDQPLREYQLNTVTYGLAPSPWHAQRVLIQLVQDEGYAFPAASRVLLEDTFMDDIITGANSLADLFSHAQQLVQLLRAGGFELSKWISNSKEFLAHIHSSNASPLIISDDQDQSFKILGIRWEPTDDILSYHISLSSNVPQHTKRSVLSVIASVYDPLGFISPLTFTLKCFMQTLWMTGLGWDDPLPDELATEWHNLTKDLSCLSKIRLPRCVVTLNYQSAFVLGFSDASERGYGCVIYLVVSDGFSQPLISLLLAKSKVAPLKGGTIPRLELAGALLLARSIRALQPFLSKLSIDETLLFTDSSIVLSWLNKPPHTLKMYVANRVTAILEHTSLSQWRHIISEQNPADIVSRGLAASALPQCLAWFQGPLWMSLPTAEWPKPVWSPLPSDALPEVKPRDKVLLTEFKQELDVKWMSHYSSFLKIQRIQAYILRFVFNCRKKEPSLRQFGTLTVTELRSALLSCVFQVQKVHFSKELSLLRTNKLKSSSLIPLTPFIDPDSLLRVGGRLENADLAYTTQHQLLLPKHSHFTHLLIDYYHKSYLHAGPRTLRALIQRKFWILSAHSVIRQRLRKCLICTKFNCAAPSPLMANLPPSRVKPSRPFLHCGVDLAGPFLIKDCPRRNARLCKGYFALFICMATKAVHIEALTSLTSECFIATLSRFVSRRGLPSDIYCDQGTNFRGAARELKEISQFLREKDQQVSIQTEMSRRDIQFHFTCPRAPFMGGIWESNIKNVKNHFRRVVGTQTLTLEEFITILARIEAVLNSRPLCDISTSPNEVDALTPGHFLIGSPLLAPPEPQLMDVPLNRLSRWQLVSRMSQHFWQRWSAEYLLTLQQKAKWFHKTNNLQPGQLVWIKEDGTFPLNFPLGRVEEIFPNKTDGIVRVVSVRTSHGLLQRPVRKLAPLFLSE